VLPPGPETCSSIERPAHVVERLRSSKVPEQLRALFGLEKVDQDAGKKKTKRFWREAIADKQKEAALGEVDTKRIKVDRFAGKVEKKEEDEEKMKEEGASQGGGAASNTAMAAAVEPPPDVRIRSMNPEKDFEHWLAQRTGGVDTVSPAIQQMCSLIERFAEDGEDLHGKALRCLTTLRRGCVSEGEVVAFNDFVRKLRRGETKSCARFWEKARDAMLGLITDAEVPTSTVTAEEARAFLAGEDYSSAQVSGTGGATAADASAPPLFEQDLEDMLE